MDDDDTDFVPSRTRNTGSNLASLFGFTKQPLLGNSSLTYSAPKEPKRESSPNKINQQFEEKVKGKILLSKAVHAYKLIDRNYESQGVLGMVISGNHNSRIYEFILYKKTTERLMQIRISGAFIISVSPNNYVSFYDKKQNWSIRFGSEEDVSEFSQRIAICKFFCQLETPTEVLIQDLEPASKEKANADSTVSVKYNVHFLTPEKMTTFKENVVEKIKLSNYVFAPLSKSLVGCAENCKRVIIIPYSLCGSWINELPSKVNLLIQVKIEKFIDEVDSEINESILSLNTKSESPIDSSVEETVVKSRSATIKEALASTKSQKAKLISRMARMGQATLPVNQGLSTEPSDSEEEIAQVSHSKPRVPRHRNAVGNAMSNSGSQTPNQETPQQLAVYQNEAAWHQAQLNKLGLTYQHVMPVSTSSISTPTTDANMSGYFSESRIQAAEIRMGISKISEKLDLVWNKLQQGTGFESKPPQPVSMDAGGILTSIQNIISENESLKEKVEEQKAKMEQQNDRIFNLLELNHKYLERNTPSQDKQSESETKLKTEMESLQKKEIEMEKAKKMMTDKMKNLEEDLAKAESTNAELKKTIEGLQSEMEALKQNLEDNNQKKEIEIEKAKKMMTDKMKNLEEDLAKAESTNAELKKTIEGLQSEMEALKQNLEDNNQKKEIEMEKAKKMMTDKMKNLEEDLAKAESTNAELKKTIEELQSEMEALKQNLEDNNQKTKEVENLKEKLGKASETLLKLKDRLREVSAENESLKSVTENQKAEIETGQQEARDLKRKNEEYEKTVEDLKKKILNEETKNESKLESLSNAVAKLEEENQYLLNKIEAEADQKDKRNILLKIFSVLKNEFSESEQYTASDILTTIGRIFNDEVNGTLKILKPSENVKTKLVKPSAAPAKTSESKQELKSSNSVSEAESAVEVMKETSPSEEFDRRETEQKGSSSSIESENKEEQKDGGNQKKKDNNRYTSYDQGWRTDKPPPPPLFDDDDDDDDYWPN